MDELLINAGFSWLLATVKNPQKKATFKKAFLKLFNAIKFAYANDPDFQ
jgi:hypothetical protein